MDDANEADKMEEYIDENVSSLPDFRTGLSNLLNGQDIDANMLSSFSSLIEPDMSEFLMGLADVDLMRRRELVDRMVQQAELDFRLDFVDLFFRLLADEDARVRESAINGLWEHDRIQFIRPLVKLLGHDSDFGVRAAAATSLGRYMFMAECDELDERRAALVRDALHDAVQQGPDIEVQRRALESIAYLAEDWVMDLIDLAYDHEDPRMRQSSLFAMGRTAEPRWAPIVLSELGSAEPAMRYEAVRAAGELGLEPAIERLIALTEDLDGEVQEIAIWALGQIGGKRAKEVLDFLLENGNEAQALAAEAALDEIEFATRPMQMFVHEYNADELLVDSSVPDDDDDVYEIDDEDEQDHPHTHVHDDDYDEDEGEEEDTDWPDEFLDFE